MGLDISIYRKLTKIPAVIDRDSGEPLNPKTRKPLTGNVVELYPNPSFPGREKPFKKGVYRYQGYHDFRAGSYGGYNEWREKLAKLAGYPTVEHERFGVKCQRHDAGAWATKKGPFIELINFSDCEGVIGSTVAKKLAKDFANFQTKVDALSGQPNDLSDEGWFKSRYAEWRKAFDMAAKGGAVCFH